ncbi:serine/threonine-protein kinase [Streptomyces phaeofaciens JCM 4814]|uniref:Serine/threonine protein kinase n=1 Tax=Streptomyces phaeofaciens TaxID=68254 RepID=A0A918LYK4_9ACTN|nr:PQQ-binding-like beta-propeller repeat protein [Streptomyces phaeofaciens]GGT71666.1 serine/threonine protein kinase [Streptomyces phaeofaciens]
MPLHKDDPKALGGYRIVDRLGSGGMGVVYLGRSRSGREVAVKVVHAQYAEDKVFRARFRQEIDAVRKVSGAFTAPVVDADPEAARPWMATQYVPGPALSARIRGAGPLKGAELRLLALGLVEALRDIHRAGVVHRDLKPANVLMAEDGPRVIDFGISRAAENQTLTETGHAIGTPPFMSPEQFADARSVGPASDVFSLGALLVFAATGRGPFDADSPYLTAYRVMHEEPSVDAVAEPLRAVLTRCLAKEAGDRPGLEELGREFAEALPEPAAGDDATVTLRLPPARTTREEPTQAAAAPRPPRRSRLRRWPVLAAVAGVVAVAVTGYVLLDPFQRNDAKAQSDTTAPRTSRWDPLPTGWKPWRTSVYGAALSGVTRPMNDDGAFSGNTLSCAMGEDALYCGGSGVLPVRVDGATGRLAWRADSVPSGVSREEYDSTVLGERDGVVLVRQSVVSSTGGDPTMKAVALDSGTGERLWSRPMDSRAVEPAVIGDLLLAPDGSRVTARDPRDGTARWTTDLPAGPTYSCKFHDIGGLPYAGCSDAGYPSRTVFYAVDPADGTTRKVSVPDGELEHVGEADGDLVFLEFGEQDEALSGDSTYTAVLLIDPDTGTVRRKSLAGSPRGEPALVGGVLCFAASSGRVTAHAPGTGKRLWATSTTLQQPGRPVPDERGRTLFAASASGRAAALDTATGRLLWESPARAEQVFPTSFHTARVFPDGGSLVVLAPDGTAFALDPAHPDREPLSG